MAEPERDMVHSTADDISNSRDDDYLVPLECVLDPTNPANSAYQRNVKHLKNQIVKIQAGMEYGVIDVVKRAHLQVPIAQIAQSMEMSETAIKRILATKKARQLKEMLLRLQMLLEGPTPAHRKNMLYEIMTENIKADPRTTIAAISETNKMEHNEKMLEAGLAGGNTINITINSDTLPRTELDQ